jgi:UDPglucose 6-dehydrogenase
MNKIHKVGIVGHGFVGLAVETGLQNVADVRVYDKYKNTESLQSVVENSEIIFICVPTPMNEDRSCDISIIEDVIEKIDFICKENFFESLSKVIVIKSTVTPGVTEGLAAAYPKLSFVFNPEFLRERSFLQDFLEQDRIILGTTRNTNRASVGKVVRLYKSFTETQQKSADIYETNSKTAEMIKYVANAFLATKVSFFNEIYDICKESNVDYEFVRQMVLKDKRIGQSHSQVPGMDGKRGFSGKCFPKDLNSLISYAQAIGVDPLILEAAWIKNLLVREDHDWEDIPGAVSQNMNFKKC